MSSRRWIEACLLFLGVFLLSACGKEEAYQPEVGIDGYVYTAEKLWGASGIEGDIKVAKGYVYYTRQKVREDGREDGVVIERFSLEAIGADGTLQEKPQPETVLNISPGRERVPDHVAEKLQEKLAALEKEDEEMPRWGLASDGSVIDIGKASCLFKLQSFDVDAEGNIYCQKEVLLGRGYEFEAVGSVLDCTDRNGEMVYQIYSPDMIGFALYGDKGACILGDGRIYVVDGEGLQKGEVATEHYRGEGKPQGERLLRDAEGHIYYGLRDQRGLYRGFELIEEGGWELREIGENFGEAAVSGLCASTGRKLLCSVYYEDLLYEYDVEAGSERQVLEWVETGFPRWDVESVAWMEEGRLLALCRSLLEEEIYLLSRTSVEELPERETITLFSASPTPELRQAVINFNRENNSYRVIIDDYGVKSYSFVTMEADTLSVDLAIVSKNPPDMLDMTFLDLEKYAGQGALENLFSYLEESIVLAREDFMEGALEGVTVDGCLTCIPASFRLFGYLGRKSQLEEVVGWDMETVYEFTEGHFGSEHKMVVSFWGEAQRREYLLGTFCACYCLEKFVDWEKGECRFDSEELGRLLDWVEKYAEHSSEVQESNGYCIPENAILFEDVLIDFNSLPIAEVLCGEDVELVGLPSADGRGKYWAAVIDALGITANSTHKEGAWAFLEYFLSQSGFAHGTYFPIRKDAFDKLVKRTLSWEDKEALDGERQIYGQIYYTWLDKWIEFYAPTQEQAEIVIEAIRSADFRPRSGRERMVLQIISEEAESYYNGDKSIEEVTRIIQNRVSVLIQER